MKIILIAGCAQCPHGAPWNIEMTEYMCSRLLKVNKTTSPPLRDCPLDDAWQKIKELLRGLQ